MPAFSAPPDPVVRSAADLPDDAWREVDVVGDDVEDRLQADARRCPAARTPVGVNVYEHSAVDALLRDRRAACRMQLLGYAQGVFEGPLDDIYAADLLNMNGPQHMRIRRIAARALTPKRVEALRPEIALVVDELVGAIRPGEPVEAMSTLADELPVRTICRLLGVPREDVAQLHDWLRVLPTMLSMDAVAHEAELVAAYRALHDFARIQLDERRRRPADDLTSAIAHAEDDGDRMTPDEAERFWVGLLNAGQETTRNVLGRGLALFADNPAQWALLHADPGGLAASATEEVLRLAPNTPIITPRLAEADLDLVLDGESWRVPAGTVLFPVHSAANRDVRAYGTGAERFDIRRDPAVGHLTFGSGPHFCAGASLARAEIAEVLASLARAFAGVRAAGAPRWRTGGGMYSLEALPLVFSSAGG